MRATASCLFVGALEGAMRGRTRRSLPPACAGDGVERAPPDPARDRTDGSCQRRWDTRALNDPTAPYASLASSNTS